MEYLLLINFLPVERPIMMSFEKCFAFLNSIGCHMMAGKMLLTCIGCHVMSLVKCFPFVNIGCHLSDDVLGKMISICLQDIR